MDEAIITTSWDDGHPCDLKLAELLNKYNTPATFYIPIYNKERERMSRSHVKEIARIFDIGGHGYHHVNLTAKSLKEAENEIVEGKKALEQILGREVLSFCYPYGSFNDEVAKTVRDAGFIGARTTQLLTRSITDTFKMGVTINSVNLSPTRYIKHSITSRDPKLSCFMLKNNLFLASWKQLASKTLDFTLNNGGFWHLWGHSWEIDANNDWKNLEEILHQIDMLSKKTQRLDNSQLLKMCGNI